MSETRYCSTCGTLLRQDAVICGECGARYQASPYERRATTAPGAWSQAPKNRSRDLGPADETQDEADGIEILSREDLAPRPPGATALRARGQYDHEMVTQPPTHQTVPGAAPGTTHGPGSPGPAPRPEATAGAPSLEPPLDGCVPGTPVKRLLAALIDGALATLMTVPIIIGVALVASTGKGGALPLTLVGVGAVLPLAFALIMIWLSGAKGFTLGKLALGLRIARHSAGGPIGFVRALGRWVVFGAVWPVMALSIFLDPTKHLRGFHDRAVDSIVVDITSGRNPMRPRADDFEREGAEHYLGSPSVPVAAHENLLARPGAAWEPEGAQDSAAPQSADSTTVGAPSPYAPPAPAQIGWSAPSAPPAQPQDSWSAPSAPQAPVQDGWSVPPVPSASQQSAQDGWSAPQDPAASAQAPADDGWAPSAPAQSWSSEQSWNPGQSWDRSAAAAPQGEWAPPPAAPVPQPEVPQAGSSQAGFSQAEAPRIPTPQRRPWDPPTGMQSAQPPAPAQGPDELTGDAWDDSEVDEQTRLSTAHQDLGDLEQTRLSRARLPIAPTHRLTLDDGTERVVDRAVVIGRNPASEDGALLFVLKDETRSVSKTHLRLDGTGDEVVVTDLGSTNGSSILREDGSRENLVPNTPTVLPTGAQVTLGDRSLSVVREK